MPEQRLSDSYHRARRMFALLCGILIAWEYIGIRIGGDAINNNQSVTGIAPGIGLPVTIRNPEIIPTIIFILVLYFSFRFTIEWRRSPTEIRNHLTSIIDAVVAYLIGFVAVNIFAVQRITQIRFANVLNTYSAVGAFIGFSTVTVIRIIVIYLIRPKKKIPLLPTLIAIPLSFVLMVVIFIILIPRRSLFGGSLMGCFGGIFPPILFYYIKRRSILLKDLDLNV